MRSIAAEVFGKFGARPKPRLGPLSFRQQHRLEDIRIAMLDMLGAAGSSQYPSVTKRIVHAPTAQELWYARSDLMAAMADLHGEQLARTRMGSLSVLFDGLLPKGLMSRTTSLNT